MQQNNSNTELETLFTRRHPELLLKDSVTDSIWKLIFNSYVGGIEYYRAGYLIKYPKESENNFTQRKKRCAYFNQVSPIVDMLSGMLFLNEPKRTYPKELAFFIDSTSKNKNINMFSKILAAYSLMFTVGVLIDTPRIEPEKIKTKRDRIENKVYPYAVLYLPFKIRDFSVGDDGELDWVLLDNSYRDASDPMVAAVDVVEYRLWTRTYFRDFTRLADNSIKDSGQIEHGLKKVPFRFVSWRDDNNDFIGETIFEDIATITKLIYNSMSYMDEMLASGTFKMLSYPTKTGELPPEVTSGGLGPLSAIPYDGTLSNAPDFIGASLQDIDSFIKAMSFYMAEILKKVGLDTDETKEFVKSGVAKKVDFQKMRSLLESGATMIGLTEEWMIETAGLWMGSDYVKNKSKTIKCEYTSDFSSEELYQQVSMLQELLVHPFKVLRQKVLQVLVKKLLSNSLTQEEIDEINKEIAATGLIETEKNNSTIDTKSAAEEIKDNKQ